MTSILFLIGTALMQIIQMQLSIFFYFFLFLEFRLNFEHFEEKYGPIGLYII